VKLFLDTNLVLDMFLNRDNGEAKTVFHTAATQQGIKTYLNDISLMNAYYILTKYSNKTHALEAVKVLRAHSRLVSTNETIIDLATESMENLFSDFEDAVQFYCAKSVFADFILTRNKKDFTASDITVLSAGEWLHHAK
jgi:predicted nucleic acid-binding protein